MATEGRAGGKKTGGRKKGTPNRVTAELKQMIRNALDNAGGEEYLQKQASENPVAFMGLLGKILPAELKADLKHEGNLTVEIVRHDKDSAAK